MFQAFSGVSTLNVSSTALSHAHWANAAQIPYQVSIKSLSPSHGGITFCSGVILNSFWVLTTANCVVRSQMFFLRFNALTHYTNGQTQTSYDSHIHPFYNPHNHTNDVALIRLSEPLASVNTTVIALPTRAHGALNVTERLAVVSGWGRDVTGRLSPVLTYAYGQILNTNSAACREHWDGDNNSNNRPTTQRNTHMCANLLLNLTNRRECYGDRGSPIAIFEDRRWVLLGISIFEANESECHNSTNLYTRIFDVRDWISNITSITLQ